MRAVDLVALADVITLVLVGVKKVVPLVVKQRAKANAKTNVQRPVQIVVIAIVLMVVQQVVLLLVKAHALEAAQVAAQEVVKGLALAIVDMGVAEDALVVLQPARIRVRLKPHKDVKDAVIHAKQAVEDNAIGLVVALVINSVKVPV